MYKVLIVDENIELVKEVSKLVKDNIREIGIVGSALTGIEGVDKTRELQPQIILTGIRLNGLNGIEMIRRIREFDKNVHIIIITRYDQFDFMRESLRLKVDDYILRPIKRREIVNTLERIIVRIKEENIAFKEKDNYNKMFDDMLYFTQSSFLYSILYAGDVKENIDRYRNILRISDYGYAVDIELDPNAERKKIRELFDYVTVKAKSVFSCMVCDVIANKIIILLFSKEANYNDENEKKQIVDFCYELKEEMQTNRGVNVTVGIGGKHKLERLHTSFSEAIKALKFAEGKEIVQISDLKQYKNFDEQVYKDEENELLDCIRLGKDEAIEHFAILMDMLSVLQEDYKRNKIIELLVLSCHVARSYGENEEEYMNHISYFDEMRTVENKDLMFWANQRFQYIFKAIRTSQKGRVSNVVSNAIRFLEKNYMQDITLEEVAASAGVTPQYFSRRFKDEMGENFVEWVANIRIAKAKELISSHVYNIKEICFMVGYNDPNYFSRIFKKCEGVTPSQYAKELKEKRTDS